MKKKLNIAFLWHMHQPLYKDPFSGEYAMPWTLLHGTKDYYDMAAILEEFPSIHQTFNIVPSLIEQIKDYCSGGVKDRYMALTLKDAETLQREDKLFLLERFFQANWDNMIRPQSRYWELLKKRGFSDRSEDLEDSLRYFSVEDFRDLQMLFNLAWIDPHIRAKDAVLSGFLKKERNYTEDDKRLLVSKQLKIIESIIPKYVELKTKGSIEITTSPYYHPILPLLCDSFSAREAMPDVYLPKERFLYSEDAAAQIKSAIALYKEVFGDSPDGLWPSEGSVSMEILPLLKDEGIRWIATDEEILSRSIGKAIMRDAEGNCKDAAIYSPYSIETVNGARVSVIFRDKVLSDLIGFEYCRWDAEKAAGDFMARLAKIHSVSDDPESLLVSVILDGENAWESYKNDGRDFLVSLYSKLSKSDIFRCPTISEYLSQNPPHKELKYLYSGSWINHNFKIWIGHPEDNTAWDYITETRKTLASFEKPISEDKRESAWNALYAAEGSDWFWWYGDEHASVSDSEFDSLFRNHLKKVYSILGEDAPDMLDVPIIREDRGYKPPTIPTGFINPIFDGEITNYYEWLLSGKLEPFAISGAMHKKAVSGTPGLPEMGIIKGVSYGFNLESVFFRMDYFKELLPYAERWELTLNVVSPRQIKITAVIQGKNFKGAVLERTPEGGWTEKEKLMLIAAGDVVEIGIPFKTLSVKGRDELKLFIDIDAGKRGKERWPQRGLLFIEAPTEDFELEHWMV